jgi:endonuclease G
MKRLWLLIYISHQAIAQIANPKPIIGEQIVNHLGYSLSYNEKNEQASWVAYELTADQVRGTVNRKDSFRSDPLIKTGSASLSDYKGSGYDRGHLAPAADMKWSTTAMSESFFMSNMSPQLPGFNRGIWKKLESKVRDWAIDNNKICIVTAGILDEGMNTIGSNSVSIPNYYYKVILDYTEPELKAIGFILPNKKSKALLQSLAISVDSVEIRTGIDFFYNLPDDKENELESIIDLSKWNWK